MNESSRSGYFLPFCGPAKTIATAFLILLVATVAAASPPFSLLHSFSDDDGNSANGSLILDGNGFLYGTTAWGPTTGCSYPIGYGRGCGEVFKVKTDGTAFTIIHSFSVGNGADGAIPFAGLILDANDNLYGTASSGGMDGGGTLFTLKTDGSGFSVLHSFPSSPSDGDGPGSGLILDANGNLYGTTIGSNTCYQVPESGIEFGCGTVFTVRTDGTGYRILHTFVDSPSDGSFPVAGLILDGSGYLYGTTEYGGYDQGTVFKLNVDGTAFTLLHTFNYIEGPIYPTAGLILDANGNLYGTTPFIESNSCLVCGAVFTLKTDGSGFSILHAFSTLSGGLEPQSNVILDASGNLYGTAPLGGANDGTGTVFAIKTDGAGFTVLHSFSGSDGTLPFGSLVLDGSGNLYGATSFGGMMADCSGAGCGTVFKIALSPRSGLSTIPFLPLATNAVVGGR